MKEQNLERIGLAIVAVLSIVALSLSILSLNADNPIDFSGIESDIATLKLDYLAADKVIDNRVNTIKSDLLKEIKDLESIDEDDFEDLEDDVDDIDDDVNDLQSDINSLELYRNCVTNSLNETLQNWTAFALC